MSSVAPAGPSLPNMEAFAERPDSVAVEQAFETVEAQRFKGPPANSDLLVDVLDISNVLTDGAAAMVDDSFMRCFTVRSSEAWNFNFYLLPIWCFGVLFRYLVLFPLRLLTAVVGNCLCIMCVLLLKAVMRPSKFRKKLEMRLAQAMCWAFLMSWSAVVKFHGPTPVAAPNRIWVANHSSMIDYGILNSYRPFCVIMQLQGGWVRFIQTNVLSGLGCLWFNRNDIKDRQIVGQRMKEHVSQPDSIPLLIFPEGTCVNNEYTVLFKRGAFDMGCTVCPVAIKYNKIFVDAFWNSKRQSFGSYLVKIMTSWALVCDVWFLEPQNKRDNETADEFASRVQQMIAAKAGLKVVPWDGYLKYYNLGERNPGLIEKRRKGYGDRVKAHLDGSDASGRSGSNLRRRATADKK